VANNWFGADWFGANWTGADWWAPATEQPSPPPQPEAGFHRIPRRRSRRALRPVSPAVDMAQVQDEEELALKMLGML
jgi:hypothetical protein